MSDQQTDAQVVQERLGEMKERDNLGARQDQDREADDQSEDNGDRPAPRGG